MKVLHLLSGGGIGGIEMLCHDIAQISKEQHEFCFLYSGGVMAEQIQAGGAPVYLLFQSKLPIRIYKLWKLVKGQKYDVVIVHHEGIGIYAFYLMLTYCFPKIKYIKYLHCSFEKEYFYQGNRWKDGLNYFMLKKALFRSNRAIAVSEFVKKSYCKEFDYDAESVKVVYNGIRKQEISKKVQKKVKQDEKIGLLYIGRLVEVKGIHLLLHAVQKLAEKGEDVFLEILGDGPKRTDYEQLAKELHISEIVFFRGNQLDKQPFFDRTQIFVYPSVWQEAFGISIVEALAQGMICVAADVGGIPEIIEDGKDGFLFRQGDTSSLEDVCSHALLICRCEKAQDELANQAQKKAEIFNIQKTIADLQEIYKELLVEDCWRQEKSKES